MPRRTGAKHPWLCCVVGEHMLFESTLMQVPGSMSSAPHMLSADQISVAYAPHHMHAYTSVSFLYLAPGGHLRDQRSPPCMTHVATCSGRF